MADIDADTIEQKPIIIDDVIKQEIDPDLDPEETLYYTDVEIQGTERCLENIKLIIRDFETQLDWHLKTYMRLKNYFASKNKGRNNNNDGSDGSGENRGRGGKRKQNMPNGAAKKRRSKRKDDSEEDTDSEMDEEDEEDFDSEDYDDEEEEDYGSEDDPDDPKPKPKAKKAANKGAKSSVPNIKIKQESEDEIEEEFNELIVPKTEKFDEDDDSMSYQDSTADMSSNTGDDGAFKKMAQTSKKASPVKKSPPAKKTPAKRGKAKKNLSDSEDYTPAKGKGKGKAAAAATPKKTPARGRGKGKKALQQSTDDDEEEVDKKLSNEELYNLIKPKLINNLEEFQKCITKPLVLLEESNAEDFDFENDVKDSDFLITYENSDDLPSFIYDNKEMIGQILAGSIKVVQEGIYEEHMSEQD